MILCFLSVSLAVGCIKAEDQSDDEKNDEALQPAEHFVYRHLMSDQGLIKNRLFRPACLLVGIAWLVDGVFDQQKRRRAFP
ncbi:hypothetical protein B4090_4568 [Bacillus licheniformis]|nr:hypothetical protein B4090_4568 [Bacillus licheniformis]